MSFELIATEPKPSPSQLIQQAKAVLRARLQWWEALRGLEKIFADEIPGHLTALLDEIAIGIDSPYEVSDFHAEHLLRQLACTTEYPS